MNNCMNKSKTLIWWDDEVKDSYLLCLEPYNLKLLKTVNTENEHETEITVYGKVDDINRFVEDIEDDSIEPFENISLKYEDCDEYYDVIRTSTEIFINLMKTDDLVETDDSVDWDKTW